MSERLSRVGIGVELDEPTSQVETILQRLIRHYEAFEVKPGEAFTTLAWIKLANIIATPYSAVLLYALKRQPEAVGVLLLGGAVAAFARLGDEFWEIEEGRLQDDLIAKLEEPEAAVTLEDLSHEEQAVLSAYLQEINASLEEHGLHGNRGWPKLADVVDERVRE